MSKESELEEREKALLARIDGLVETIKGLRVDLRAATEHARETSEQLERMKRRQTALGNEGA